VTVRNPRPLPSSDLAGIEPASPVWEADVVALNYARVEGIVSLRSVPALGAHEDFFANDAKRGSPRGCYHEARSTAGTISVIPRVGDT
jgi:hypothetical protein